VERSYPPVEEKPNRFSRDLRGTNKEGITGGGEGKAGKGAKVMKQDLGGRGIGGQGGGAGTGESGKTEK